MELHLEVNASLSLEEAHAQASEFEQALREAVPGAADRHPPRAGRRFRAIIAEPTGELRVERLSAEFLPASGCSSRTI